MAYAQHFSTRSTPQSEAADPRQVENNAGGFTFAIDRWQRLHRWLILGSEGGTYYATERALTVDNAKTVVECLDADGARAVSLIVAISDGGRAPKNDPAVFALAIAAGHKDPGVRRLALDALPKVCRIGTHLFQFLEAVQNFRGWGRGLRRAIGAWYESKPVDDLMRQVTKYAQRNQWSHRDALRLAHLTPSAERDPVYRWVVGGADAMSGRKVARTGCTASEYGPLAVPAYLAAFDELKCATDPKEAIRLIGEHGFTHEMVPGELKGRADVWEALLAKMPLHAMVRNLAKMTAVGLIAPMGTAERTIAAKLADPVAIHRARLHPMAILLAMKQYQSGHGDKGKLTWSPSRIVLNALDGAFYAAFQSVEPTGKRTLLALDVSGSMDGSKIAGTNVSAREASGAMAMVTARTEPSWHAVAFTSGMQHEFKHGAGRSQHYGYAAGLTELDRFSPKMRLDAVIQGLSALPMGGTDCALPMLYATARKLPVDVFVIYTDNETWHGSVHPHQALREYRERTGIPAKLVVVGMTATEFSIADPSDAGMLDVVGFDAAAPAVLADFAVR